MVILEKPQVELLYKGTQVHLSIDKKDAAGVVNTLGRLKPGVEYDVEIKERARRSLNANAYHWTLVNKIAEANGISNAEVHNQLLCDYGEDWLDASGKQTLVMMADDDSYRRMETTHYRPTDMTETRGNNRFRWFVLLLPSHLMDRKQMSRLVSGTQEEAKQLGIEVRTPDEIAELIAKWEERA